MSVCPTAYGAEGRRVAFDRRLGVDKGYGYTRGTSGQGCNEYAIRSPTSHARSRSARAPVAVGEQEVWVEPGWVEDRRALVQFKLRALIYGIRIRWLASSGSLLNALAGIASLLGLAVAVFGPPALVVRSGVGIDRNAMLPVALAVLVVWVAAGWLLVRGLTSLPRIIGAASRSEAAAAQLREDMEQGMANEHLYRQLRAIYAPLLVGVNSYLGEAGLAHRFELVTVGASDLEPRRGAFAAAALPTGGAGLRTLLGSIVALPVDRQLVNLTENRQRLMLRWKHGERHDRRTGLDFERGDNYCLAELRVDTNGDPFIVLDVGVATYGQVARTCEALVNEAALFG